MCKDAQGAPDILRISNGPQVYGREGGIAVRIGAGGNGGRVTSIPEGVDGHVAPCLIELVDVLKLSILWVIVAIHPRMHHRSDKRHRGPIGHVAPLIVSEESLDAMREHIAHEA